MARPDRLRGEGALADLATRVFAYWATSICVLFTVSVEPVVFLVLGLAALAFKPKGRAATVAFYLAILFAVPIEYQWQVPMPGINYLLHLDHTVLLSLVLMAPLLAGGTQGGRWRAGDALVVFVIVSFAVLDLRDSVTVTNGLRTLVTTFLVFLVPYLAFRRSLVRPDDLRLAFVGLSVGVLILAAIGFLSWFQQWLHYFAIIADGNFIGWSGAFRGGGVRVHVTMATTLLGLLMAFGLGTMISWWRDATHRRWLPLAWVPVMLVVLQATGSRGAILALMVFGATFFYFRFRSGFGRFAYAGTGLLAAVVGYAALRDSGFEAVDEYGTFDYRQRLLDTAMVKIGQNPLFGDALYDEDPIFEPLRQGQGIIDFVNAYVQLTLGYGLFGLLLLLAAIGLSFLATTRTVARLRERGDQPLAVAEGTLLGCTLAAYAVMIVTISLVSYIELLLYLLIGLNVAYARVWQDGRLKAANAESVRRGSDEAEVPPPVPEPDREPEPAGIWPEGYVPGRTGWPS
jgi:O-antigen ligase